MIATQIKALRNQLDLSQTAFGERLNVSRNVINNLELGRVEASDMMVSHICNTFGVNEKWLREGVGEMFAPTIEDELTAIAQRHGLDEMDVAILRTYINLPKEAQTIFKNFILAMNLNGVQSTAKFNETNAEWSAANVSDNRPAREKSGDGDERNQEGNAIPS